MRTIAEMLRWRARRHPDLPALVFERRTWTYGELDRSSSALASGLIAHGLQAGDRVAILASNCDAYLELFFALDKAGAVAAPLNRRLTAAEINRLVDDIAPRMVVTDAEFAAVCEGSVQFSGLPRGGADPHRDTDGAVAWQFNTSGTTGLPKSAMLTGANLIANAVTIGLEMTEVGEGSRFLDCLPMFHIGGAGIPIWAMHQGATVYLLRDAGLDGLLDALVSHRIEATHLVPTILANLAEHPGAADADFSHLLHIAYGAAPMPPAVLRRCLALFDCRFTQFYGLTETTGPFASLTFEHHQGARLASCGRPMMGGEARILGPDGEPLAPGQIGEIVYRGPNLMAGYAGRPEATVEAVRDGWFHTGDAGMIDDEGFIFIKDRLKDMIVTGGENVYPAEIEAVLAGHPDVLDVAVIGTPDAKWGESVKAVVVSRDRSALAEAELMEWARERLAGFKRPKSIDFTEALPRNPSGKLLKRELRARYCSDPA